LKHVLTATDLSASSMDPVERGFLISKATGARYTILHAANLDPLAPLMELLGEDLDAVRARIEAEAETQLRALVAETSFRDQVPVDVRVVRGRPATVIPQFAAKAGAELMVIGAQGHGFLHRILLGSTASVLLRESACPVLIVKQPPRHVYKRVLVAIDFSKASRAAVRIARAVAPEAALTLLHVFELPYEGLMFRAGLVMKQIEDHMTEIELKASEKLRDFAQEMGIPTCERFVARGDATRRIISHQEMFRSDLIVLGKHGTNVTQELLLGSVTNHLAAESQCDLLVIVDAQRPQEEE
jgi:nucleotide-binding universal stress UspA family protein